MDIAAIAHLFVQESRRFSPARKQNAKFFRTLNISFVEGATSGGSIFDADTGAGGSHSAGPGK
jgi:hypothetical protein